MHFFTTAFLKGRHCDIGSSSYEFECFH